MKKGLLIVVSGPAGSGKGTVAARLIKTGTVVYSVSATTRAPRPGEKDGINYHFIDRKSFIERIESGDMIEHTEYCGNFYGTPKAPVLKTLNEGKDMLLEIEVEGMRQVKAKLPDAVTIFIAPPSIDDLAKRIKKRNPDEKDEVIENRINRARKEMEFTSEYDHVVINDALEDAYKELAAIIADYIRD
jgi:guanylate kinase